MDEHHLKSCTAFKDNRRVASGNISEVVRTAKEIIDKDAHSAILIFDDMTSELVEVDLRGTMAEALGRLENQATVSDSATASSGATQRSQRGPGRPRLGVVPREVTLLPRHWDWLNSQPGGASVTLRRLVEEARRVNSTRDKVRHSQEAAFRFMSTMAGDFPGFEEAIRALFAGDSERFNRWIDSWSVDIRDHALKLAEAAFQHQ